MIKKSLLLTLLMTLLVPWAANAQATLPIGTGTSYSTSSSSATGSGSAMGNCYNYYSTSQFIYTAEELGGAKSINSIAFNHNAYSMSSTVNIYLAHTTASTVDVNNPATEGTLVSTLSESTIGGSAAGWQTFNFSTPFEYNGTDNLLVVVCRTKYNSGWSNYLGWQYTATSDNKFMTRNSDSSGYDDITNTSYSYTAYANRPNVIIGYVPTTPYISLDPTSETVLVGLSKTITATYGNVSGTPTITYSSSNPKIASVSGSGTSATVTGESVGTATITATMTYNATDYTATCAVTVEEPSYCKPSFSNTSDYIKSFTTTGGEQNINNTNTGQGTGGYSNFYDTHFVSAEPETEIGFSVVRGYDDNYNYAIWVDWNKDYEFDNTTEKVAYTTSSTGDWTGSFTIPAATAAGDYHMRVLQVYSSAATPCVSASYGEGEDYKLTVLAGNPYQKPTDLTVIEHGPFNATIGWTAPSADVVNYQYQYMPDGGAWTALTTTTALNAPLSGLTDDTDYTFRVKAIYAGGESDFATKEFSTDVACEAPTNLTATDITADGATLGWTSDADNFNIRYHTAAIEPITFFDDFESGISQWTTVANDYSGTGTNWRAFNADNFNDPNITNHSGSYVAMSRSYDGSDHSVDNWLITPQVTLDGTLKFWAINDDGGGYAEHYSIYVSTTGNDVADFTEIYVPDDCTAWTEFTVDLTSYNGVPGYIAIRHLDAAKDFLFIDDFGIYGTATPAGDWKYTTSNTNSKTIGGLNEMTLYDFEVQAVCGGIYGESDWVAGTFETLPNCMPVSDLDVAAVTTTTVTLVWTDNNGGSATYVVTDGEDNPVTVTGLTTTGCTVTGLIANTAYTFKVKADCGSGYSTAVTINNVRTDCNLITTFPYEEGFEGNGFYCWTLDGFGLLSGYAHDGDYSIYAAGSVTTPQYVILPEMGQDISGLMLNFWYYNFNSVDCGTLYVGYLTDDSDYSTFASVGTIDMSTGLTDYEQTNNFTFVAAPAGSRMALKYVGSGGQYAYIIIDDATVDVLPACMPPYDLEVDNTSITAHGATFSWTSNGSETEWHLYFSKDDTAPANDIPVSKVTVADSNPFTVTTGLDAETDYYVWVRASCGTDGNSSWVGPATFTTGIACPAPTGLAASEITGHTAKLSWNGTSESYVLSVGTYDYAGTPVIGTILEEDFEDGAMQGWTTISNDNDSYAWSIQSGSAYAHESNYCVRARYTSSSAGGDANDWLISPQIAFGGNISFYAKRGTSNLDKIQVYVSTTGNNISDFTAITEEITLKTTYEYFEYDLSSYSGNGYVAIVYTAPNDQYYVYVDDITITGPTYPIAWTDYDNITTTSKTVDGLDPETPYFAKVKGNCGSEGYSQETAVISFTTDVACPAPSGLAYSNPKSDRVTLAWTNGGAADWVVAYKLSTDTDFTEVPVATADVTISGTTVTYTLTGLTPEKEYNVKVQDNCEASISGDGTSDFSNTITFETLEACAQPTGVTVDNIGHYSADLTWTGDSPEFIVKYRTAAFNDGSMLLENFNSLTTAGTIPTNWNNDEGTTTSTNYKWCHNDKTSGNGNPNGTSHDGSNCVVFNSYMNGDGNTNFLKTPSMDFPTGKTMQLTFWWKNPTGGDFSVYISTDGGTTKTPLKEGMTGQTAWKQEAINLTDYIGASNVTIFFKGTSNYGSGDAYIYLDDVIIGEVLEEGSWQTLSPNPTTSSASLTGLSAGQKYEVKVTPSCDATLESTTVQFTTMSANEKQFITAGDWATATNWLDGEMPTIADNAVIKANATINNGTVATANNISFQGSPTPTLTIENGGQLKHNNTSTINATVKKTITGYGTANANTNNGYVLFAPPISKTIYTNNSDGTGLRNGTYDLYTWNRTNATEWTYYGSNNSSYLSMSRGTGYLYACEDTREITFTGSIYGSGAKYSKSVSYNAPGTGTEFSDWNLIGNPFVCDAYLATEDGKTLHAYYKMNDEGNGFTAVSNGAAIASMQGIFYQATAAGNVYFFRELPSASVMPGNLNINVAQVVNSRDAQRTTDNAIIRFGEGNTLEKFSFREGSTKVYIPQEGKDYAVVNGEAQGEMPVNFKAETNGTYTLSFTTENVDFSYLHLIDNMTGNDVDLLDTPSYTFDARYTDYASRFKLVYAKGSTNTSDNFGFISNGNLMILGIEGEATLQVIDVTGRVLSSETFSGSYNKAINASAGVYMIRLIQGNDVRTQKIVVR